MKKFQIDISIVIKYQSNNELNVHLCCCHTAALGDMLLLIEKYGLKAKNYHHFLLKRMSLRKSLPLCAALYSSSPSPCATQIVLQQLKVILV